VVTHPLDSRIARHDRERARANANLDAAVAEARKVRNAQWAALRKLRMQGKRPAFPVFITALFPRKFEENLGAVGAMVIRHAPGEPMPVELLDGLDVCLHFANCEMGGRVVQAMRGKGVTPKSVQVWCNCANEYTVSCGACDDGSEPWAR
jgi:hypothetical protein